MSLTLLTVTIHSRRDFAVLCLKFRASGAYEAVKRYLKKNNKRKPGLINGRAMNFCLVTVSSKQIRALVYSVHTCEMLVNVNNNLSYFFLFGVVYA